MTFRLSSRIDSIEWFLARLLFAPQFLWRPEFPIPAHQPFPTGWATIFDFSFIAQSTTSLQIFDVLRYVAVILYIQGRFVLPATALMLLFGTITFSLCDSQGSIAYVGQMSHLVLLGQLIALLHARYLKSNLSLPQEAYQTLRIERFYLYSQIMALLIYFNSALTKLKIAGLDWIFSGPNIALQIVKSYHMQFYNYLDQTQYQLGFAYAQRALDHPWAVRLLLGSALVLELLGVLALFNRRLIFWTGCAFLLLHESIRITMHIHFAISEMIAILFLIRLPRLLVKACAAAADALYLAKAPSHHLQNDDIRA